MSNLSKAYGYYGGVTKENHYVPPKSPPFIPQPPSIPFTTDILGTLETHASSELLKNFLTDNSGSIVFRRHTTEHESLSSAGVQVFEIATQDNPQDVITYDTTSPVIDLARMDGGTF